MGILDLVNQNVQLGIGQLVEEGLNPIQYARRRSYVLGAPVTVYSVLTATIPSSGSVMASLSTGMSTSRNSFASTRYRQSCKGKRFPMARYSLEPNRAQESHRSQP